MKVLFLGPSGSGKTYVSRALRKSGIHAFDDGAIKGYPPGMINPGIK